MSGKIVRTVFNIAVFLGLIFLCSFYFILLKLLPSVGLTTQVVTCSAFIYLCYKVYIGNISTELIRILHRLIIHIKTGSWYKRRSRWIKNFIKLGEMYSPAHYHSIEAYVNLNNYYGNVKIKLIVSSTMENYLDIVEEYGVVYVFTTAKLLDRYQAKHYIFNQLLSYKLINFYQPRNFKLLCGAAVLYAASCITIFLAYVGPLHGYTLFPIVGIALIYSRLLSLEEKRIYLETDQLLSRHLTKAEWQRFVKRSSRYKGLLGLYSNPKSILELLFYWILTFSYTLENNERIDAK